MNWIASDIRLHYQLARAIMHSGFRFNVLMFFKFIYFYHEVSSLKYWFSGWIKNNVVNKLSIGQYSGTGGRQMIGTLLSYSGLDYFKGVVLVTTGVICNMRRKSNCPDSHILL